MNKRSIYFILGYMTLLHGCLSSSFQTGSDQSVSQSNSNGSAIDNIEENITSETVTYSPSRLYVTIVTHNEDTATGENESCLNFFSNLETRYWPNRRSMQQLANIVRNKGATWDFQTDVEYLQVLKDREGAHSNVLRDMLESFSGSFTVQAHAHESFGKNYADVANFVEEMTGLRDGVVGGFTAVNCDRGGSSRAEIEWEKFWTTLLPRGGGANFDATILSLGASAGHGCDPAVTGIWRPKDKDNFLVDDPALELPTIGVGIQDGKGLEEAYDGIVELVEKIKSGEVPSTKIYTASVTLPHCDLDLEGTGKTPIDIGNFIDRVNALDDETDFIRWAHFPEMIGVWKEEYGAQSSLWYEGI